MTTRKQTDKAAESKTEDKDADVKTAGTNTSQTDTTTASDEDTTVPEKVEGSGETDVKGAASGEVAGGVVRGDTGLDGDFYEEYDGGHEGALGVVQEGGQDVPWTYLTADDVRQNSPVRTSDSDDGAARAWNVQATEGEGDDATPVALIPVQQVPGQTFHPAELPNVEVMEAAGIDSAQWLAGLPVRADLGDDETHRRGIPA